MYYTIYKVTNKINGKFYIGSHKTKNLDDNYMGSGKYLKYSQDKYGIENFTKEILYVFDTAEEMYAKEAEIVNVEFLSEQNTYNIKIGGFGGFDYINSTGKNIYYDREGNVANGNPQNLLPFDEIKKLLIKEGRWEEYKKKRSDIAKKHIEMYGGNFKGKKHSDTTKKLIGVKSSIHQSGKGNSQYGTKWIYSLQEKRSMKINKNDDIPEGWFAGRKIKF